MSPPVEPLDYDLWDLLEKGGDRVALLNENEARAAMLMLQVLASGDGVGHEQALDLAGRISRRLPTMSSGSRRVRDLAESPAFERARRARQDRQEHPAEAQSMRRQAIEEMLGKPAEVEVVVEEAATSRLEVD